MLPSREKYRMLFLIAIFWTSHLHVLGQTTNSGWTNKLADICFVLDSSSSIWIVDYSKLLTFVSNLVADMDVRSSATRVAVSIFSDDYRTFIPITNIHSKSELRSQIMRTPYLKGDTYISRALRGVREQCLSSRDKRSDTPQIAILITDGMSRYKQLTVDNATLVKQQGIFVSTIGVGNSVDTDELRMIASDPKTDFHYHVPDFNHLDDIRVQLSNKLSQVDLYQGDAQKCGGSKFDTIFVFDQTAFGEVNTKKIKEFIKFFVTDFSMNSGNVRAGVVSKTCHEGDIVLGQYVTQENFVNGLHYNSGPEISELLKRARMTSFLPENGARSDAKQRIVLIMHSNVEKKSETTREAVRAKFSGIEMFVIQLGNDYDKTFINNLVSHDTNALFQESVDDLLSQKSKDEFKRSFCEEH